MRKAATRIDNLQKLATIVAGQVKAGYPRLDIHFIIHPSGQLAERMALAEYDIVDHPASAGAKMILDKKPMTDRSGFLGIAMKKTSGFWGFGVKEHFLALININSHDFDNSGDARHTLYHLAWHAIDLMEYRQRPDIQEKLGEEPMAPKRSELNLAMANLKADVFAVLMAHLQGDEKVLGNVAYRRAHESLIPYKLHRVEEYPYIIAAEATQYALDDLEHNLHKKIPSAQQARKLSVDIGQSFEETHIRQWWGFATPAQNMAWAGHDPEEILGAAINTCEDPFVRATGYIVGEAVGIKALSAATIMNNYNSFSSYERNERLHRERMESIFESALSRSIDIETSDPMIDAANTQNEDMSDGKILGWCAGALQAAARTFDSALKSGDSTAADRARELFNEKKQQTSWKALSELGEKIIEQKRDGFAVTLGNIANICDDNPAFAPILNSLKVTMQDPSYVMKLQAANDLNMAPKAPAPAPAAAPKAPTPKSPAPQAPAANFVPTGPSGPSLGGAGTSQMARARALAYQKRMEQHAAAKEDGKDKPPA